MGRAQGLNYKQHASIETVYPMPNSQENIK